MFRSTTLLLTLSLTSSLFAAEIPSKPSKQTDLGLYLTAQEAFELKQEQPLTLLVDVRSLPEITFLGMPTLADAHIPFKTQQDYSDYNAKTGSFKMKLNPSFVADIEALIAERELNRNASIILMCRSGGRSAQAADKLTQAGFTRVFSVVDGYEGDKAKSGKLAGQRVVNGWRNAGLPWSYQLDFSKLHGLPAAGQR